MAEEFLTPVSRTTLTADICRKMVGHLLRGDWSAGDRIPAERELCLKLGVGRASLREALKALEIMGMLETRLGDGTYVCKRSEFLARPLLWAIASSSETEANELVEARKLIEIELAGLSAERATPDDLKRIGEQLDVMEHALEDSARFVQADVDFHLSIGLAAHNSVLMNALHLIRNLLQQWISSTLALKGVSRKAYEQHRQIFLCIVKRNRSGARKAMQIHLEEMAALLLKTRKPKRVNAKGRRNHLPHGSFPSER